MVFSPGLSLYVFNFLKQALIRARVKRTVTYERQKKWGKLLIKLNMIRFDENRISFKSLKFSLFDDVRSRKKPMPNMRRSFFKKSKLTFKRRPFLNLFKKLIFKFDIPPNKFKYPRTDRSMLHCK